MESKSGLIDEVPGLSSGRVAIALLAFTFGQYALTLRNPFFFDDSHTIQNNSSIQVAGNLWRLWTSASYSSVTPDNWGYRPMTTFANSLAWLAGGGATWPFHLEKILAFFGVCYLLFRIWERLWRVPGFFPLDFPELRFPTGSGEGLTWTLTPRNAAIALAFVFAAHPANSQVLNYISASSTLFAGFWYLLAYHLYLCFRERQRWILVAGSATAYLLSILSKEEGITLIAVIALTELVLPSARADGRSRRQRMAAIGILALAALAGAGLLRCMFAPTSNLARGPVSRWDYFMTQWRAYPRYMAMLVWPWDLNADNLEFGFSSSFWDYRVLCALFGNLAILATAWLYRRRFPVFLFGILWFYIGIAPASSIVPLAEPVNDHRMFIAYFGLAGAVFPWFLKMLEEVCRKEGIQARPSPASGVAAILVLLALTVGTQIRNRVWASQESLWSDTVAKNPVSGRALNNLSLVYMQRADWSKAVELLGRCERLDPSYSVCKVNQALVEAALGHDDVAGKKFVEGIRLEAYNTMDKLFYGEFLLRRGYFTQAIAVFKEIDRFTEGANLQAKLDWIDAAAELGHAAEVQGLIEEVERRFPGSPALGRLSAFTGR